MKKYKINLTARDLEVTRSWLEDRIESGHWGDNIVMSTHHDALMSMFKNANPGDFILTENQVMQIIHDAEKCFTGKFGMFNPVGSVFEIATLYKFNKTVGRGGEFLTSWNLTESEIDSWLEEYS